MEKRGGRPQAHGRQLDHLYSGLRCRRCDEGQTRGAWFDVKDVQGTKSFALIGGGGEALEATRDAAVSGTYRLRHYSDKPLLLGYVEWISSVLQGDFGVSTKRSTPSGREDPGGVEAHADPQHPVHLDRLPRGDPDRGPSGGAAELLLRSLKHRGLVHPVLAPSFWVALFGIFFFGGGDWWNLVPIRGLGGDAAVLDTELVRGLVVGLTMAVPLPIMMGIAEERRTQLTTTAVCTVLALAVLHFIDGMPRFAIVSVAVFGVLNAALSLAPQAWMRALGSAVAAIICLAFLPVTSGDATGALIPWLDRIWHLLLPVTCLTYASFAAISRFQRTSLLEVIRQDFVRTARAKGLSEKVVVWKHAVRNALIPIITLLGATLPALVGGAVIIETIFTIPGLGLVGFEAILNRDYSVVMAIALMSAVLTMLGILVSDLTYALVDPRISYDD